MEHTYPLDLLKAELKAAMAEQLVNLMDRFVSKTDFSAHEKEDEAHFREINEKLDALLAEKLQRDGAKNERDGVSRARGVLFGILATLVAGGLGAGATLAASAFFT